MRIQLFAMGIMFLALAACRPETNRGLSKASVRGTVTFEGKPVSQGLVSFSSPETGVGASVEIQPPGEFTFPDGIEVGTYQVSIAPPFREETAGAPSTQPEPEFPEIPLKYRAPHESGLTAEVVPGENQFQFDMTGNKGSRK